MMMAGSKKPGQGRGKFEKFSDEDLAARIVAQAEKKEFAMREFIYELVKSKAFQTK